MPADACADAPRPSLSDNEAQSYNLGLELGQPFQGPDLTTRRIHLTRDTF